MDRALVNYDKLKDVGQKITKVRNKGKSNYARPSHPVLTDLMFTSKRHEQEGIIKQVFTEFDDLINRLGFGGESIQEPLVTYSPYLMGGFVDRLLVTGDMKCRVQDYKINVDIDVADSKHKLTKEFKDSPKTKLAGHTIQLNYYAFCLIKAGWEVEGLDIFVLDQGWKHYELEMYPMDTFEETIKKYNL